MLWDQPLDIEQGSGCGGSEMDTRGTKPGFSLVFSPPYFTSSSISTPTPTPINGARYMRNRSGPSSDQIPRASSGLSGIIVLKRRKQR